ncbi:MAG: ABC-F type ribosomal protection protein [Clostridia bacterium]|nr:ABC-F type ribosomal protection protein [Clostridia bacterium]
MSIINITNLTFAYEGAYDNIFEDVSFRIDTDWKLGFTGRNGRGKTTFLNLLLGKYEYKGSIASSVNFEYFPYHVPDPTAVTMDVLSEMHPELEYWQLVREMSYLQVDEDVLWRPFDTLSNGEQTKVLLSVMFLRENSFLLIDEPTNHLDTHGRRLVSQYLNTKKGFILVSHDRAFLDGCIDHVLSINKTNIEIQQGNFSSWLDNKERQDRYEIAENEKLKKEIKRLRETAREKSEWSDRVEATKIGEHAFDRGHIGHKAAKMMARSKAIEKRQQSAVEEKSKLLKNLEHSADLKISQLPYHSSRLLTLKDVAVSYGEHEVCANVSFDVKVGDRVALCGKNGSGKSSILKLICGEDIPHKGDLSMGSQVKISYVSQDTSYLSGSLSEYAAGYGIDESLFKAILRKMDFSRVQFEKDMRDFSGGQKKKVLIARSLSERAHICVWDEPMNYIDVISRIQIEDLLLKFEPTVIFVEHDEMFCERIATKRVEL